MVSYKSPSEKDLEVIEHRCDVLDTYFQLRKEEGSTPKDFFRLMELDPGEIAVWCSALRRYPKLVDKEKFPTLAYYVNKPSITGKAHRQMRERKRQRIAAIRQERKERIKDKDQIRDQHKTLNQILGKIDEALNTPAPVFSLRSDP